MIMKKTANVAIVSTQNYQASMLLFGNFGWYTFAAILVGLAC